MHIPSSDVRHVVASLTDLRSREEPWSLVLESRILVAVNQDLTGLDALIRDGDEVAFFPPVTGG